MKQATSPNQLTMSRVDSTIAPLRTRRRSVAGLYGGFLSGAIANAMATNGPPGLRIVGIALFVAAFMTGGAAFYLLMQPTLINAPQLEDRHLDERFLRRSREVTCTAYYWLSIACAFIPAYYLVASTAERWTFLRNTTLISALTWGIFLTALTLPTAIMAWTEPDETADER